MLRLIMTALALAALAVSPALSQSGKSGSAGKAKTSASKAHVVKKPAAKSRAAKKGSRTAAKTKAKGRKAARTKGGRKAAAVVKLTPEKRKAMLDDAAAINEDLIGFALEGKAAKVAEKVVAMRKALPFLRPMLATEAFEDLSGHVARMEQDSLSNDIFTAALDSAEAFRTIQEAVDPAQRVLPLEVSILDYAGYKLTILAVSPDPDWGKIAAVTKDATVAWSRLEEKVQDTKLQNLLETVQDGLRNAVLRKDIEGVKVALKKQIDALDALDRHFSSARKAPAPAD